MATSRLTTTRWVPPGAYLGRKTVPRPANPVLAPRKVVYLGRGNRLKQLKDVEIKHSFVYNEALSFFGPPYKAYTDHIAKLDKTICLLTKSNGEAIPFPKWELINDNTVVPARTAVLFDASIFDPDETYLLSYQSTDRNIKDPIPWYPANEMRQFLSAGSTPGDDSFKEGVDFIIDIDKLDPVRYESPVVGNDPVMIYHRGIDTVTLGANAAELKVAGATVNGDINYTAKTAGVLGNSIRVFQRQLGMSTPLAVTVTGGDILVDLQTDALGDIDCMASDVAVAINASVAASALVSAVAGGDGSGEPAANGAFANLAGGALASANNQVKYVAKQAGVTALTVTHRNPHTTLAELSVAVVGNNITVNLATNAVGAVTSTAADVATAVNNNIAAAALLYAAASGTGASFASVNTQSELTGGEAGVDGDTYTAKDSRVVTFNVEARSPATGMPDSVTLSYSSSTAEGGFGQVAIAKIGTASTPTFDRWWMQIASDSTGALVKDGLTFSFLQPENLTVGQKFQVTIENNHLIDWSLTRSVTDTFDTTMVLTDKIGAVTGGTVATGTSNVIGVPGATYVILNNVPSDATTIEIKDKNGAVIAPATLPRGLVLSGDGGLTVNLVLGDSTHKYDKNTMGTLSISYAWRGNEPDPGDVYYTTSKVLRPRSDYDKVIDLFTPDEVSNALAPMTVDNHLYIMAEMAMELKPFSVSVIQVWDADQDGFLTNTDFKRALDAAYADKTLTDVCVLANFGSISDAKLRTTQANDPFYRGWRLQWNGMPVNAEIGNENVKDSVIYTARRTLQIYGESPGRGTQILVANQWAKRTIQLDNGSTLQVTLDGSFIAGAMAALNNSFNNPYDTLLKKELPVFDDIAEFDDTETARVGQASCVYLYKNGDAIMIGESVTVDTAEPALNEISGRVQEQFVSRYVTQQVDEQLVSFVPDSPEDGAAFTSGFVASALMNLRARQFIAPWTDANGATRQFDPNEDVAAVSDENDSRNYYYNFWYNLRFPGKRFMGLYSVGRNAFKQ